MLSLCTTSANGLHEGVKFISDLPVVRFIGVTNITCCYYPYRQFANGLQNTRKIIGFKENMVYKRISRGGGGGGGERGWWR